MNSGKKIIKIQSKNKEFQKQFENFCEENGLEIYKDGKKIDFYYVDDKYIFKKNIFYILDNYKVNTLSYN